MANITSQATITKTANTRFVDIATTTDITDTSFLYDGQLANAMWYSGTTSGQTGELIFTFPDSVSIASIKVTPPSIFPSFMTIPCKIAFDGVDVTGYEGVTTASHTFTVSGSFTELKIIADLSAYGVGVAEVEIIDAPLGSEPVHETVSVDTARNLLISVHETVSVDTKRNMLSVVHETIIVDTARKRISSLTGHTSLSVTLAAKSLTDRFTLVTRQPAVLDQLFTGYLKDFNYVFKAKTVSVTGGSKTVTGVYDIDDLLTKPLALSTYNKTAENIMTIIAELVGRDLNVNIDNYDVSMANGTKPTYKDVVSNLFGWSDKIPIRQINVFIRGGVINVLQRGKETETVEIVSYGEDFTVNTERLKTLEDETDTNGLPVTGNIVGSSQSNDDDWFDVGVLKNGTESFGDMTVSYTNGLVVHELHTLEDGGTIETSYTYSASKPPCYLSSKTVASDTNRSTTEYFRFADGSAREEETAQIWSINSSGSYGWVSDYRKTTRYHDMGQGRYAVKVEINGQPVSDTETQGSPYQEVTAYQVASYSVNKNSGNTSSILPPVASLPARSRVDLGNLPVADKETLEAIAADLVWLDGKIQETVSLTVLDESILDYTKRVVWRGNEYYLNSNTVTQEPELFSQKVELIRWYAE
jgi:hypothetical protein